MGFSKPPYYLTAYGLAVRQGFKGTLNEWLASLYGDGVELRYLGEKLQWRKIKGAEDPDPEEGWQDILDVADTREKIFGKALDEANRAENAANRAEAAAGQIVVDQEFIETQVFSAGQASEIAAAAARNAAQSEQNTKDDADRAAGAADRAATLIGEAEEYILIETKQQADAAINARHFAEEAAGDAKAALQRTEEVADSVGSPVSYKPQTLSTEEQGQVQANIGLTVFGVPYSSAVQVIDISAAGDGSVKLYLFLAADGYDAVATGSGAIADYTESNRPYDVQKITRLHIEKGVTSIGNHFMYKAFNLKHLSFADSKAITHLGTKAFAYTSIGGEYDFSGLTDTELIAPFMNCPKLQGVTFSSGEVRTYKIETDLELGWFYSNMIDMAIELTDAYQVNGQYYACDGYALHLVHPADNLSTSIHQKVILPAYTANESKIKLSASACGMFDHNNKNFGAAYMTIQFRNAADAIVGIENKVFFKTSESWQEYVYEVTIPEGAVSVRAYIYYALTGRYTDCYVDNVSLTIDGGEDLLADMSGSFNDVPDETKLVVTEQLFADKSTITSIAEKSFQMCIALRYVNGLYSVTSIGDAAFQYCTSLESIDVVPDTVTLGNWVFILTPIDARAGDTVLADAVWKGKGSGCFAQKEWTADQLSAIRAVTGESVKFPIPESDNQGTDFYNQWGLFPFVHGGKYKGMIHPASGCCGIFSLYHIYNILHPNAQYDTFYDWMMRGVVPHKIKVTQSLHDALTSSEYGQALIEGNTNVSYEVGSEITARDLPMALDADSDTWGEEGTSFWGVCTALGWTATEMLFDGTTECGANVKQTILDNLAANKPVEMEIVGASDQSDAAGSGMHAVVAIGYDADTDKLLIIDSTGQFDSDVVPLAYWCSFESLITPYEASAIWTFDFGEVVTMTKIDNKLDALLQNASFRIVKGTDYRVSETGKSIYFPLSEQPQMVVWRATEATQNRIQDIAKTEANTSKYFTFSGVINFAHDFDLVSKLSDSNFNSMTVSFLYVNETNGALPVGKEASQKYTDGEASGGGLNIHSEFDNGDGTTTPAEYEWTAYYWDE